MKFPVGQALGNGEPTKVCSKCGEVRNANYFHRNKQQASGRSYWCKSCVKTAAGKRVYKKKNDRACLHTSEVASIKLNRELARELQEVWS